MSKRNRNDLPEKSEELFLRRAIALSEHAVDHGNHPFGAILVSVDGKILLEAENTVTTEKDCTGHAELNLVRIASKRFNPDTLAACTLYSSAEPCAMCAGAIHWSGIGHLVFGIGEKRLNRIAGKDIPGGLPELSCREVFKKSGTRIEVAGPVLEEEAEKIHLRFW